MKIELHKCFLGGSLAFFLLAGGWWCYRKITAGPQAVCDPQEIDLGVITSPEPINFGLTVRNIGNMDLEIGDVKTGCACMVVPVYQSIVKPALSTVIPVRMEVKDRDGSFKQYIVISTNDPVNSRIAVRISADVEIARPQKLGEKGP